MRMRKMIGGLLSMAVVLGVTLGASAQDVDKAQNKLLSKRAAEADAYRKLAETIKGLRITSDTLVRDFVTESDVIKSELDTFIKGVRLGEPTWYADLSCEVPAEVTVASVITHLKEMHARSYQGSTIKSTDFVQMKQQIKKDIIKVVGMGAPRPDLPPDLPEGIEDVLTQVTVKMTTPPIPDLWLQIGPQARLMAVRAAELDAQRKLLERIKGIRITSDTLVKDFVTEWDEIRSEARGYLVGANKIKTYYHHDEPIVEVTYAIPLEQVLTTIKALHTRHYKGNSVKTTDIVNVKKQLKSKTFTATGMGIPPKKYMAAIQKATPVSIPDWAGMKITAVGHGTDSAIDTPQGKLKAARAAELDAKRALIEQIQGMQISSDTLVRDFVTQYDEINAQVDGILMGALVERTEWKDGMAEVTVSVPGMEVWSVFNQQLLIIKRGS